MLALCVRDVPDIENLTVYVPGRKYDIDPQSGIAMHFQFDEKPKAVFPGYTFNEKTMMLERIMTAEDKKNEELEMLRKENARLKEDNEVKTLREENAKLKAAKVPEKG